MPQNEKKKKKTTRAQSLAQVWHKPEVAGLSPARMEMMKPETGQW